MPWCKHRALSAASVFSLFASLELEEQEEEHEEKYSQDRHDCTSHHTPILTPTPARPLPRDHDTLLQRMTLLQWPASGVRSRAARGRFERSLANALG